MIKEIEEEKKIGRMVCFSLVLALISIAYGVYANFIILMWVGSLALLIIFIDFLKIRKWAVRKTLNKGGGKKG